MRRIALTAVFLICAPMTALEAAPQMLGLFASGPTPTELHCQDGVCSAQFSAFCLQQNRDAPLNGAAYRPVDRTGFRFVVTDAEGQQKTLPATDMTIRSARNYTAVVISVPAEKLRALGAARIAVSVASRVTLTPVQIADDPNPLSASEMAMATGPHRAIGESHVERNGHRSEAIRAAMSVINALRGGGDVREPRRDAASAQRLLQQTPLSAKARGIVENRITICENLAESAWYKGGVATCLQNYHDSFVSTLNGEYWNAVGTGS